MTATTLPATLLGTTRLLRFPPDGRVMRIKIVDEIRQLQSNASHKLLCLHLIEMPDGEHQVRLAYYIRGKMPSVKGRWVWGQYATMLPPGDLRSLYEEAVLRGWLSGLGPSRRPHGT